MALSYIEYPCDGSQRDFVVTFPYLSRSHVSVKVDETPVAFTWVNNTLVRLSEIPLAGSVVRISRHTPFDRSLVDFVHGGRLAEDDLDTTTLQILYLLQEYLELEEGAHIHDQRYYTEEEIDTLFYNFAGPGSHNHDERYYTETEINTFLASKANTSTTISAGTGLSGGGSLAASRTISHASHTGDVTGSTKLTIGNATITQSKLKVSSGSVQTISHANLTLPGGAYGFYPQLRVTGGTESPGKAQLGYNFTNTNFTTIINLAGTAANAYAQQRYVTSSGEVFWIFLLRNKSTGQIEAGFQSPDHPCFGNGNDPLLCPHPFPDYDPLKHEIIVVNPDQSTVDMMKRMCRPQRMGERPLDLLELIVEEKHKHFEIDENSEREYSKTPVTVGVIHDLNEKPLWLLDEAPIIHLPIPQPEYVKVKALVERRPKTYVY